MNIGEKYCLGEKQSWLCSTVFIYFIFYNISDLGKTISLLNPKRDNGKKKSIEFSIPVLTPASQVTLFLVLNNSPVNYQPRFKVMVGAAGK